MPFASSAIQKADPSEATHDGRDGSAHGMGQATSVFDCEIDQDAGRVEVARCQGASLSYDLASRGDPGTYFVPLLPDLRVTSSGYLVQLQLSELFGPCGAGWLDRWRVHLGACQGGQKGGCGIGEQPALGSCSFLSPCPIPQAIRRL